jgi:hypothetical protein
MSAAIQPGSGTTPTTRRAGNQQKLGFSAGQKFRWFRNNRDTAEARIGCIHESMSPPIRQSADRSSAARGATIDEGTKVTNLTLRWDFAC